MLSLDTLSRADKLKLMEALWDDLSRDESSVVSPDWHAEVLDETRQAHAAGQAQFIDWAQAKRQLRGE